MRHSTNYLHLAGLTGITRKTGPLEHVATCPNCLQPEALTIRITAAGQIPGCRTCSIVDVWPAFRALEDDERTRTQGAPS